MAALNFSRSSALSMASRLAPIISTPWACSTPCLARSSAQLSAVWPPMVGSSASGLLQRDHLLHHLPGDRFDVGGVRQPRVGHDGGRVGVDQDDAVALLLQRLAGLRAGVVELAGLADHDRAGADDEDAVDVGAFGHLNYARDTEDTVRIGSVESVPTEPAAGRAPDRVASALQASSASPCPPVSKPYRCCCCIKPMNRSNR